MASCVPRERQTLSRMGAIFAVADGMVVHASRRSASRLAVLTVIGEYYRGFSHEPEDSLRRALSLANQRIREGEEASALSRPTGTSLVAAVVRGHDLLVGDSRAYMLRGSQILRLTRDHSWTAEALAMGALTTREAARHPWRHVVTRALGTRSVVQVDVFRHRVQPRDTLVLCSDGLYRCISDRAMRTITNRYRPPQAARKLAKLAARRRSGDDATALVVRVSPEEPLRRVARRQVPACGKGRAAPPTTVGSRRHPLSAGWHELARVMAGLSLAFLVISALMVWLGGA